MESIIDTRKGICHECGAVGATEEHHCFFGHSRRKIAEREGLKVYLCHECHRGTSGVHGRDGHELDIKLKKEAQQAWEAKYIEEYPYENHAEDSAREAFIRMMGKNYL